MFFKSNNNAQYYTQYYAQEFTISRPQKYASYIRPDKVFE